MDVQVFRGKLIELFMTHWDYFVWGWVIEVIILVEVFGAFGIVCAFVLSWAFVESLLFF